MQFAPIRLKALKPKETYFEPQTLGEHLRRRRLELELTQKQAAARLGVSSWTILNWEKGHTEPPVGSIPAITYWLGYDPFRESRTLQDRMLAKRRVMGWSIREAARQLGVDEGTWAVWESGVSVPSGRFIRRLEKALSGRGPANGDGVFPPFCGH